MIVRNKLFSMIMTVMLLFLLTREASAFASLDANQKSANQAVPAVSATDGIKIDLHHMLLESTDGTAVKVKEVFKVVKTSGRSPFKISLPEGYTDLEIQGMADNSYSVTPEGMATVSPLEPGTTQITLFYQLPFTTGDLVLSKATNYPTDVLYVLSPKGQFRINSTGITDYGIQSMDGREYHVFVAEKPAPGQKFSLTLNPNRINQGFNASKSGFHSASHLQKWYDSPLASTNPHLWVAVIALLFFGSVTAFGYYQKQKRQLQQQKEAGERLAGMLDDLIIRQSRLLAKINVLDCQKEAGEIQSEDYGPLREQYMDKLVKIKLKIKELEFLEDEDLKA